MTINIQDIKNLRTQTGAGMMDCRKALEESAGNFDNAVIWLRKKGLADIKGRSGKSTNEGSIGFYIHTGGRLGVLVDINCETDFVANGDEFQEFVHDVALHVAAANPKWVNRTEIPQDVIDREVEVYASGLDKKPDNIKQKIISGKLEKFYKDNCLMEQVWVKDPNKTITDLMGDLASKIKENIVIKRFARFAVGE